MEQNRIAGTWKIVSAFADPGGKNIPVLGSRPSGLLIFTENLYFSVVVNNPEIPKFISGDRFNGTPEENKSSVINSLGLFGTYTVDDNGDFLDQHVIGSTFPNWNDIHRGRTEITETVQGNQMIEHLKLPEGLRVEIIWEKVI